MNVPSEHLYALAALLFAIGTLGFLLRRNVIIVLASIELMLNAHELTGDRAYLQRAEHFARWSIQTYLGDSSLPRASHRHDHYEAVTGGDALMMALLDLWTVKQGRQDEVDLVWVDR